MVFWLLEHFPAIIVHFFLIGGILLLVFGRFLPSYYSISARTIGIVATALGLYLEGLTTGADVLQSQLNEAQQQIAKINDESKNITKQVVVKYVVRDKVIKDNGNAIQKQITTKNDHVCTVYGSSVELLNSAAENRLPRASSGTDETATQTQDNTIVKFK